MLAQANTNSSKIASHTQSDSTKVYEHSSDPLSRQTKPSPARAASPITNPSALGSRTETKSRDALRLTLERAQRQRDSAGPLLSARDRSPFRLGSPLTPVEHVLRGSNGRTITDAFNDDTINRNGPVSRTSAEPNLVRGSTDEKDVFRKRLQEANKVRLAAGTLSLGKSPVSNTSQSDQGANKQLDQSGDHPIPHVTSSDLSSESRLGSAEQETGFRCCGIKFDALPELLGHVDRQHARQGSAALTPVMLF